MESGCASQSGGSVRFFEQLPLDTHTTEELDVLAALEWLLEAVHALLPQGLVLEEWARRRSPKEGLRLLHSLGLCRISEHAVPVASKHTRSSQQKVPQTPPDALGVEIHEEFWSHLPPDDFLPEEVDLRSALLDCLQARQDAVTLEDLEADAEISQRAEALLPAGVPLTDWVMTRIGGEIDITPDEQGNSLFQLPGSSETLEESLSESYSLASLKSPLQNPMSRGPKRKTVSGDALPREIVSDDAVSGNLAFTDAKKELAEPVAKKPKVKSLLTHRLTRSGLEVCKPWNDGRGCPEPCRNGQFHGCDVLIGTRDDGWCCGKKDHNRKQHLAILRMGVLTNETKKPVAEQPVKPSAKPPGEVSDAWKATEHLDSERDSQCALMPGTNVEGLKEKNLVTVRETKEGELICKRWNDKRGCSHPCPQGSFHGCDVLLPNGFACGDTSHNRAGHLSAEQGLHGDADQATNDQSGKPRKGLVTGRETKAGKKICKAWNDRRGCQKNPCPQGNFHGCDVLLPSGFTCGATSHNRTGHPQGTFQQDFAKVYLNLGGAERRDLQASIRQAM